ncbi:O-methyltransferase [Falsibacillus pallidus]|uniref:Putative O-methyltransferase YrrM n=1 Tax=Falsibacillus pallidus TaxID=493781 RepID=A0A370GQQ0_9BACI|nr:O-methyltransferase [Falsibacillus pallidus]RDI45640.1 putative O-methyltransferase YrrM [Falsibacillus pallidus]
MSTETWKKVDEYFTKKLHEPESIMDNVLKSNEEAGLPSIDVSPNQGKLLNLLVQMKGATKILEIGTLGGYSTIWMARALPENGKLITLEYAEKHADVARKNIEHAGISDKVEIMVGAALDSLPVLEERGEKDFDFIFIDADKPNNPHYLEWALKLSKPGTVIIGDNVVRDGKVVDEDTEDAVIKGVQSFIDLLSRNPHIDSTAIQTVGSKGYDGFVLGIVK